MKGEHLLVVNYGMGKKDVFSIWYSEDEKGRYIRILGQDDACIVNTSVFENMSTDAIDLKDGEDIRNFVTFETELRFLESDRLEVEDDNLNQPQRLVKDYTELLTMTQPEYRNVEPYKSYRIRLEEITNQPWIPPTPPVQPTKEELELIELRKKYDPIHTVVFDTQEDGMAFLDNINMSETQKANLFNSSTVITKARFMRWQTETRDRIIVEMFTSSTGKFRFMEGKGDHNITKKQVSTVTLPSEFSEGEIPEEEMLKISEAKQAEASKLATINRIVGFKKLYDEADDELKPLLDVNSWNIPSPSGNTSEIIADSQFKKKIGPAVRAVFKKYGVKGSLFCKGPCSNFNTNSTIGARILSGPIDFTVDWSAKDANDIYSRRTPCVLTNYLQEDFEGKSLEFLLELRNAMRTPDYFYKVTDGNHQEAYDIEIEIGNDGKYKPYQLTDAVAA